MTTIVLGYLDSKHTEGVRRALPLTLDEIPKVFEKKTINERAMSPIDFEKDEGALVAPNTLLIKSPMGTGKTKALVDYINSDQVPKDAQVIIVSFRRSFTNEVHKNIGVDFVNYQDVFGQLMQDKVIVQFEASTV